MTILDIMSFFDLKSKVIVYTDDGKSYSGIITGVENDFETDSGVDEIELDVGTHYFAIELSDIVKIEKVA